MLSIVRTVLIAVAATLVLPSLAEAQVNFQIGISDDQVKRKLRASGHTELKIVKRSLSKIHVEACRDGKRLYLRLDQAGRILERSQRGTCRRTVSIDQAQQILRNSGYRRINIEQQRGAYVAVACRDGQRQKVTMSRFGEITKQRNMGSCRPAMSPSDVTAQLQQQGYNRIKFTDDELPRYVARACRGDRRVELVLNRRGKIRDQFQIGKCDPPINPDQVPGILAKLGYDQVQLTDDKPPRYQAEACRGRDRIELTVNRFGKVVDQLTTGRCPAAVTQAQLANSLSRQGFRPVFVEPDANDTFTVNVCRDGKRILASFSKYGEILDQRNRGKCSLPTLDAIANRFDERGLSDAQFFIEGCRDGRRVRIRINPFGERVARERLGRC